MTDYTNLAPTGNQTTQVYARYDQGGIIANVKGVNTPTLFARCARLFEEYAVKGFSLEWSPNNVIPTDGGASGVTNILGVAYVYQDLNTYDTGNYSQAVA